MSADAQTASTAELAELCKSTLCGAPKVRLLLADPEVVGPTDWVACR